MPSKCVVHFCKNYQRGGKLGNVSYHRFPTNEKMRSQWMSALELQNFIPKKYTTVCSKHFKASDFITTGDLRKLRKNAIPTLAHACSTQKKLLPASVSQVEQRDTPMTCDAPQGNTETTISASTDLDHSRTDTDLPCNRPSDSTEIQSMPTPCEQKQASVQDTSFSELEAIINEPEVIINEPSDLSDTDSECSSEVVVASKIEKNDPIFLVYESALLHLFSFCFVCLMSPAKRVTKCKTVDKKTCGTCVWISTTCARGHRYKWSSQPIEKFDKPLGNIKLAAAMLFAGCEIVKTLRMLASIDVCCFTERTYYRMQKTYLVPAITKVWKSCQAILLSRTKSPVTIGGDGTCDSPGHCTYCTMDLQTNTVIDVQLIQSNEVQGSEHMEKAGLSRALSFLVSTGLNIAELVTDSHVEIKKFMQDAYPKIKHTFDTWHLAKDGPAHTKLKQAVKDVGQLSQNEQIPCFECFQRIITYFAPNLSHYLYKGMQTRCYLAALHYYENGNKSAVHTRSCDKKKKGQKTVSLTKEACTYKYVTQLFDEVLVMWGDESDAEDPPHSDETIPPCLSTAITQK